MRVLVDSTQVFSSSYTAGASNFTINVPIPSGDIAVQIENTGQDWFNIVSYEFAPGTTSLLSSVGLQKEDRALIWIYDVNSQYGGTPSGTFSAEPLYVYDLADGMYDVDFYATRGAGGISQNQRIESLAGLLSCTIPDFTQDIAIKVRKVCTVDLDDLIVIASNWLQDGQQLTGDLDGDININMKDLGILSANWLGDCPSGWPIP